MVSMDSIRRRIERLEKRMKDIEEQRDQHAGAREELAALLRGMRERAPADDRHEDEQAAVIIEWLNKRFGGVEHAAKQ